MLFASLMGLIWHLLCQSVSGQVSSWNNSNYYMPNNDDWTVYGYSNTLNPRLVHVFGGIKFPKQHYAFDLKTQAVIHFNDVGVPMNCHVQPLTVNDRVFFMNDHDATFYSIDLASYAVNELISQPRKTVLHVCTAQNDTHLFMLGGMDNTTKRGTVNTQAYNLNTKKWVTGADLPRMNQARYDFSCGVDPNTRRLYAIGGQVDGSTFTNNIEFILTKDIRNAKWRNFKYTLSYAMALYNQAIVPLIISQARRRTLVEKELPMEMSIEKEESRRLQGRVGCSNPLDLILVLDESCGWSVNATQCNNLKGHLLHLVELYRVNNSTRIGIVVYRNSGAVISLPLSKGVSIREVVSAISRYQCGNTTQTTSSDLASGFDLGLNLLQNDVNNPKYIIVYPICEASNECSRDWKKASNVTVSIYVSGNNTVADNYDCLVNDSKSTRSNTDYSLYFLENPRFDSSQYSRDAISLENLNCPRFNPSSSPTRHPIRAPTQSPTSSPTTYQSVQFIIVGGYTGECCPPNNQSCNGHCENPNTVFAINLTTSSNDLNNPCFAARYYNNSNISCGIVPTTTSIGYGRRGARLIYYDCDNSGPTLWVFGGQQTSDDNGGSRTITHSNSIKNAYPTCPVPSTPAPILRCPHVDDSSSSSHGHRWWKSLSSSSSSSSSDNSYSHYKRSRWHH